MAQLLRGGFMTAILSEEKDSKDIDFFFTSQKAFDDVVSLLNRPTTEDKEAWAYSGYKCKTSIPDPNKPNNTRYLIFEHPARPAIQLLKMVWYESAEHVIDTFDLSVCQFAVDNKLFYYNPISFVDLSRKRIVLHRMQFPASTLRRIIKYSKKGFYACPGSLGKICEEIQKFAKKFKNLLVKLMLIQ